MKTHSLTFILLLLYCLFVASCTAPTKGCDDPNAVNYAFNADAPCGSNNKEGDCPCAYPRLLFDYVARYSMTKNNKDTLIDWKNNLVIANNKQQYYYLRGFSFFISDIKLMRKDGTEFTVSDSVTLPIKKSLSDSSLIKIPNTMNLLGQQNKLIPIGTFKETGLFSDLQFKIGLNEPVNQANIYNFKMPGSHPLNTDSLYVRSNWKLQNGKIWYQPDTLKATKTAFIWLNQNTTIKVAIPEAAQFKQAADATLKLFFDFRKLFEDIDFKLDNQQVIENKVNKNFTNAFSIKN
jgi:hypothetical protein